MGSIRLYDSTTPTAQQRQRQKQQYFPAATSAANQVGVILVQEFGQQQWIIQCMQAVQEAVQNCIINLSGTQAPLMNAQPIAEGGQYTMPARTAQEIQQSAAAAAHQGQVSAAHSQQLELAAQGDQALANGQLDMFALLQKQAGLQDPASQGMPPTDIQATEVTSDAGSDEWLI